MRSTRATDQAIRHRQGFTLIELLTVIVIIGILAALLIPAVSIAITRAKTAAMRTEVEGLSQAIEAYNTKYGDYPPDFSDWSLVQRHYRKIFPNIAQTDLLLLLSMCTDNGSIDPNNFNPTRLDRAEALVWSLGGFSSDPERPFTGTGGPIDFFVPMNMASLNFNAMPQPRMLCQYNTERDNSLFDFDVTKLGLLINADAAVNMSNHVMSTDDPGTVSGQPGDWFPVYRPSEGSQPYVYFDSRTYTTLMDTTRDGNLDDYNGFFVVNGGSISGIRPYASNEPSSSNITKFANSKTYQIIGPGIDGQFGTHYKELSGNTLLAYYFQYPTGVLMTLTKDLSSVASPPVIGAVAGSNGYSESSYGPGGVVDNFHLDNVTNFSSGTLDDDVVQ